jgi:hypothetical protein
MISDYAEDYQNHRGDTRRHRASLGRADNDFNQGRPGAVQEIGLALPGAGLAAGTAPEL